MIARLAVEMLHETGAHESAEITLESEMNEMQSYTKQKEMQIMRTRTKLGGSSSKTHDHSARNSIAGWIIILQLLQK